MPPKLERRSFSKAGAQISGAAAAPKAKAKAEAKAGSAASSSSAVVHSVLDGLLTDTAPRRAPITGKAGSIGVHQNDVKTPVSLVVQSEASDAADSAFGSAMSLPGQLQAWACKVKLNGEDWDVHVRGLEASGGSKVALCLHGAGPDRCVGFWASFWSKMNAAGYHVLAIDMPGHGRSGSKALPARGAEDAELVLAVLSAFTDGQPGRVSCFADTGGCAAFVRAFTKEPAIFSGHHVLVNPVVSEIPSNFKSLMDQNGTDFFLIMSDGWGKTDVPFTCANCGVFFGFMEEAQASMAGFLYCKAPEMVQKTPGLKAEKDANYLAGKAVSVPDVSKSASFYSLVPSKECEEDLMGYVDKPRREPIAEGGPSAPMKSALEMGEINESFRVFVRIRPMLQREDKSESCVKVEEVSDFPRNPPPHRIKIQGTAKDSDMFKHHGSRGEFVFDRVFEPGNQLEVFESVAKPLVNAVLQGTNITMFAYGQTGTGKTFTMEGPSGDEGLMHQAVHMLFENLDSSKSVYYQYVQLYNADFKDLLDPESKKKLVVEEGKNFMKVRGANMTQAQSAAELMAGVREGAQYRAAGKTNMNDASSRSHAILAVIVTDKEPEDGTVMYLVDLAGSERVSRSGVTAGSNAFNEATNINSALSALSRVTMALVERDGKRAGHIPYKDNALTELLKSGIGGNSKTALISCITAADDSLEESLNTLRFAMQASHVKNKVADKEKKDKEAAAAEAIEDAGNVPALGADGTGEIDTPQGKIHVKGSWSGGGTAVICLHALNQTGSQFDGVINELQGQGRILAPNLEITTEKDPTIYHSKLLALLDWLGIAKPVLYGRDMGAVVAASFKVAHPTRAGPLVLDNMTQKCDEAEYKKRMKANPDYVMKQWQDCWAWIADIMEKDKAKQGKNVKSLKGKVVLLWPCHFKGNPDPKMKNSHMALAVAKALKTQVVDSYTFTDVEVAAEILKVM